VSAANCDVCDSRPGVRSVLAAGIETWVCDDCSNRGSKMKLRLVQDHDAACQPWFRCEQYLPAIDDWYIIASGPDREKIKERFDRVLERQSTQHTVTVIEERDA
jgi:hypothetical protein